MIVEQQNFKTVDVAELSSTAQAFKDEGYRFVQSCANRVEGGFEITYSFDKDLVMENVRVNLADGVGFDSVSTIFPSAFVFENEMHDLFGIEIAGIIIDFKGKFYKVSVPAPMVSDTTAKENKE